jgi:hypothetical protein
VESATTQEILLVEEIQTNYSPELLQSSCLCWSAEVMTNDIMRRSFRSFQVAILDETQQVCQVLMYQLYYDPAKIEQRVAAIDVDMDSAQFLEFLKKSTDVVSLNLIGMNVIVLKN